MAPALEDRSRTDPVGLWEDAAGTAALISFVGAANLPWTKRKTAPRSGQAAATGLTTKERGEEKKKGKRKKNPATMARKTGPWGP
jgi:hypothetical protein